MSREHFLSGLELDELATGVPPTPEQKAILDASPELREQLKVRKQGFDAWPDLDERRSLASLRTGLSQMPDPPQGFWRRAFLPVDWADPRDRRWALVWTRLGSGLVGATAGVLVAAVFLGFFDRSAPVPSGSSTVVSEAAKSAPEPALAKIPIRALRLADGSTVDADPESKVVVEQVAEKAVAVRLDEGRARFAVTPNKERTFEVRVGKLIVQVLGTNFVVNRGERGVGVRVIEGLVQVKWPGGLRALGAQEETEVSYDEINNVAKIAPLEAPQSFLRSEQTKKRAKARKSRAKMRQQSTDSVQGSGSGGQQTSSSETWQSLVRQGQHYAAYEALRDTEHRVSNTVGELLLAADAARFSGHTADAVRYLQKILDEHGTDKNAALAAFTLGMMYLRNLKNPKKAVDLFQRVRALEPDGPLAGDALAREVQTWTQLGEATKARALAEEYLRKYPSGPRSKSVKHFGGIP